MMKSEFEKLIGKQIGNSEYEVVEKVYTWHPAIKGKEQMKVLYTQFGMGVIRAMIPAAEKMMELDVERRKLEQKMRQIKIREQFISEGDMGLEEAIDEVGRMFAEAGSEEEFEEMFRESKIIDCHKETARDIIGC